MSNNPLSQYFRTAELYIKLPSNGRWWPSGSLELPQNGEVEIYSMTGIDDLSLRNADGLMNGDTSVKVLQSCCPSIKNAWDMPSIDTDSMFIAIRIASYGHQMDMETKCEKCKAEIEYSVDLRAVLESIKFPDYDIPAQVDDKMSVYLKPAAYRITTLDSQEIYQQQRAFMMMRSDSLSEEDKTILVRQTLEKMTKLTVSRMIEYIDRIVIDDSQIVTDRAFINEFIERANRKVFNEIKDAIAKKNSEYQLPKIPIVCDECGHHDTRDMSFDPSTFFG